MIAPPPARLVPNVPTDLAVLHDLRAQGKPALPILWGGFVAAGDWR